MKIAIWHNLPSGGGKRAMYHHVEGLIRRGHQVEIWTPSIADPDYMPLGELTTEHIDPFEGDPPRPASRLKEMLWLSRRLARRMSAMDRHSERVGAQIERGGFDLLFIGSCWYFGAAPIGRYVSLPKVLYLHEPYRSLYEALPSLPWVGTLEKEGARRGPSVWVQRLQDRLRRQQATVQGRYELGNARAVDTILVNSFFSRESVARAYGIDSRVCYLGIDTNHFRPLDLPRERQVIGLGALGLAKGIDRALRAVAAIPKAQRPELVWVANAVHEKYLPEAHALADRLEVRLTLRVGISNTEVVEALNRASVMIYTSRLEPFGFAPLEANACGTPVVAIAEGGVRETVQEGVNGLLAPHDDSEALGSALRSLLEAPELQQKMGRTAREHVLTHWTLDKANDRLENLLGQSLKQKAVRQPLHLLS